MKRKEQLNLYLPVELVKQLKIEAAEDRKKISGIITYLLERHFERRQYKSLLEYMRCRRNICEIGQHQGLTFNETIALKNNLLISNVICGIETPYGIFYEELPD